MALRVVDPPRVADDLRQVDDGEDRDDAVGARVLHQRLCRSAHDRAVSGHGRVRQGGGSGVGRRRVDWLAASCIMGVGISYSGWRARSVITATTFTLVGVLNKMATIAFTVDCLAQTRRRGRVGPRARVLHPLRTPVPGRAKRERTRRRASAGVALANGTTMCDGTRRWPDESREGGPTAGAFAHTVAGILTFFL